MAAPSGRAASRRASRGHLPLHVTDLEPVARDGLDLARDADGVDAERAAGQGAHANAPRDEANREGRARPAGSGELDARACPRGADAQPAIEPAAEREHERVLAHHEGGGTAIPEG